MKIRFHICRCKILVSYGNQICQCSNSRDKIIDFICFLRFGISNVTFSETIDSGLIARDWIVHFYSWPDSASICPLLDSRVATESPGSLAQMRFLIGIPKAWMSAVARRSDPYAYNIMWNSGSKADGRKSERLARARAALSLVKM